MEKRLPFGGAGVPPRVLDGDGVSILPHNLPSISAADSRTFGSLALLVQKVLRHFRGCGILPRRLSKSLAPSQPFPNHMVARKRDIPGTLSLGRDALPRVRAGEAPESGPEHCARLGRAALCRGRARTGCSRHVPDAPCCDGPDKAGPSQNTAALFWFFEEFGGWG